LLESAGLAIPKTWVWYRRDAAHEWAEIAPYPLVLKLSAGAGSTNIRLVHEAKELHFWIDRLFGEGVYDLNKKSYRVVRWGWRKSVRAAAKALLKGQPLWEPEVCCDRHRSYLLCQEFLPSNEYDTRITVIGHKAFGFRRFNRPGDFRASGSGMIDWSPTEIDSGFVRLAFQVARRLKTQSVAIDGLRKKNDRLIGEISYTYASWAIHSCPGHWELKGNTDTGELVWHDGHMWPEEAQIVGFLKRLQTRYGG
jgi:hypothetical protein